VRKQFYLKRENDHFRIIYNLMAVHTCPIVKKEKSYFLQLWWYLYGLEDTRALYISLGCIVFNSLNNYLPFLCFIRKGPVSEDCVNEFERKISFLTRHAYISTSRSIHFTRQWQTVPITTNVASSNPTQAICTRYNIMLIKFVSDLRQVGGFLWVLRFPPPIKLTSTI